MSQEPNIHRPSVAGPQTQHQNQDMMVPSTNKVQDVEHGADNEIEPDPEAESEPGPTVCTSDCATAPSLAQPSSKQPSSSGPNCWRWEVAAVLFSYACNIAIGILFWIVHNTPLAEWHHPIRLNTIVSILTTVSKATALFSIAACIGQAKWIRTAHPLRSHIEDLQRHDESSRGLVGSLKLLRNPRRMGWMAIIGALLTVIAAVLDPFAQQTLTFPSRIAATMNATAYLAVMQSLVSVNANMMHGAILEGIYQSGAPAEIVKCTAPVCNWTEPVTSLGVCSRCSNITSFVNVKCSTEPGPLRPDKQWHWNFSTTTCVFDVTDKISFKVYIQNLNLPQPSGVHSGSKLKAGNSRVHQHEHPTRHRHGHSHSLPSREPNYVERASQYTSMRLEPTEAELGLGDLISNGSEIRWIQTFLSYVTLFDKDMKGVPAVILELLKPEIRACALFWCAHVYDKFSVVNGKPLSTDPSASYPLLPLYDADGKPTAIQTQNGGADILTVSAESKASFPGMPSFQVNQNTHLSLTAFLANVLNISQSSGNDDFQVFPEPSRGLLGQDNPVVQERDIAHTLEVIAQRMTAQIHVSDGSLPLLGHAFAPETYVQVQGWWMTLSVLLVVGASILLGAVAFTCSVPVFKSSIWPYILYPVSGLYGEQKMPPTNLAEAEDLCKRTQVELRGDGKCSITVV